MEESSTQVSVVIPVYNSMDCLEELISQLTDTLTDLGRSYEIIMVDDASPDDSWSVIQGLVKKYDRILGIRLMRNNGQAKATMCGLAHASGEIIVTMDDDLQQRPDQLPKLLEALESSPDLDCVFGVFPKKHHASYRNLGSQLIRRINTRAFGLPANVQASSFRVIRRSIAKAITDHDTENPAITALIYSTTRRVRSVPVVHAPRFSGSSNYTFSKQVRLALDNIVNVSMLPLRAVTFLGLLFSFLSIVLVTYILYRYFSGNVSIAGWTTVVVLISFFSGIILLSLGVIGEYLVRVLREVRRSPKSIIREYARAGSTRSEL